LVTEGEQFCRHLRVVAAAATLIFNDLTSMEPRMLGNDDLDFLSAFDFEVGSSAI